jgi:hypothetical protein
VPEVIIVLMEDHFGFPYERKPTLRLRAIYIGLLFMVGIA